VTVIIKITKNLHLLIKHFQNIF